MSGKQALSIDFSDPEDMLRVVDTPPTLHSHSTDWDNIDLQVYEAAPPWETPVHVSEKHLLIVHVEPELTIERQIGDKRQPDPAQIGDIDCIPAFVEHSCAWRDRGAHILVIAIAPELVAQIAHEYVDPSRIELIPTFAKSDPLIYGVALSLNQALKNGKENTRFYSESLGQALAAHLVQNYTPKKPAFQRYKDGLSRHQLRQVIDYIQANLNQDIKLVNIASLLSMSQYHFCRQFQRTMGISPYQFVLQQRIERAKQLLKEGKVTLIDLALQCGFNSQSHLIRHFKKYTGFTPKQYQRGL